jgi:hypothetical protein
MIQHRTNTDGQADYNLLHKERSDGSTHHPQAEGYKYPLANQRHHLQSETCSTPYWEVCNPTKTDTKPTTKEPEQFKTDSKTTRSGTAARPEVQHPQLY